MIRNLVAVVIGSLCLMVTQEICNAQELNAKDLLTPERVVEIQLSIDPADWQELCQQSPNGAAFFGGDTSISNYTWFKADLTIDGKTIPEIAVRKKGFFGSNDSQRPSLKIKFDEYVDQKPIKGLNRLTLNNNKQDRSLTSQVLAYQLFRKVGVPAPRTGYANLTVNGKHLGVYTNVESIKKPFLKEHFKQSDGMLYEMAITDIHPKTVHKLDAKSDEADQNRQRLEKMAAWLADSEPLKLEEIEQWIDLDEYLKFWAVENLTGFWDGYNANQNNVYVYFPRDEAPAQFIPWGADFLFSASGPFGGGGGFGGFGARQAPIVYANCILGNRLYHSPGIPERLQETMKTVLDSGWNEKDMVADIDRWNELVRPFLHSSQDDMQEAADRVKDFIAARRDQVLRGLETEPQVPDEPRKPQYSIPVGTMVGHFSTKFGAEQPESTADVILVKDDQPMEFETLEANVRRFEFPAFGGFGNRGPRGGNNAGGNPVRPPRGGNGGPAGPPGFQPPLQITITMHPAEGADWVATMMVDPAVFKTGDWFSVNGRLNQTRAGGPAFPGFGPPGMGAGQTLTGRVKLSEGEAKEGAVVAGEFDLEVVETRGGMFGGGMPGGGMPGGARGPGFGGRRGPGGAAPRFPNRGGAPGPQTAPRRNGPTGDQTDDQRG